jgi:protein-disulfide isomerase
MFRRLKWLTLPIVFCLAWSAPLRASNENEPSGLILGGSLNSPVRIEVYSDFECPACRDFYLGTIRQIIQEYSSKDRVCVIYHEFPLQVHKYSRDAARYVEAASRLGQQKMLQVIDALYTDQAVWSQDGKLEPTVAKALSREDLQKLKKLMLDPGINSAIDKDLQLGTKNDIKSTPTSFIFYIGKKQKVEGLVTYLVFKQFIDSIIK